MPLPPPVIWAAASTVMTGVAGGPAIVCGEGCRTIMAGTTMGVCWELALMMAAEAEAGVTGGGGECGQNSFSSIGG